MWIERHFMVCASLLWCYFFFGLNNVFIHLKINSMAADTRLTHIDSVSMRSSKSIVLKATVVPRQQKCHEIHFSWFIDVKSIPAWMCVCVFVYVCMCLVGIFLTDCRAMHVQFGVHAISTITISNIQCEWDESEWEKTPSISLIDRNKSTLLVESNYQCMRSTANRNRFGHLAITIRRCKCVRA